MRRETSSPLVISYGMLASHLATSSSISDRRFELEDSTGPAKEKGPQPNHVRANGSLGQPQRLLSEP